MYIVEISIELRVDAKNAETAIIMAENVELPKEYIEDSYELLDVSEV